MKTEHKLCKITRTHSRQKMHTGETNSIVQWDMYITNSRDITNCLFDDYVKTILTESNNEKNSKLVQ